ncbi:MAG: DUF924 domain-containing protein [Polyangiaceae bacterium]|nr:DUF924 domain-containing protein [Polyangiaceae bacterium]
MNNDVERVLTFWFGTLDAQGRATPEVRTRWFKKDTAFDQEIRDQFLSFYHQATQGQLSNWLTTQRGRLALIIVLDQFSRNMFRGTPQMYTADAQAVSTANTAFECGDESVCAFAERGFLYLPLMHSELLVDQQQCIERFMAFREELPDDQKSAVDQNIDYAIRHRDIVARFGRFPHRNEIVGRESTPEEVEFLKEPGSSF